MTRKVCSVCNGRGKIPNPRGEGKAIYLPEIECLNCNGEGFVGIPDNLIKKPFKIPFYRTETNK